MYLRFWQSAVVVIEESNVFQRWTALINDSLRNGLRSYAPPFMVRFYLSGPIAWRKQESKRQKNTVQSTVWCQRIKEASKYAITPQTLNISLSGSSNHTDLNKTWANLRTPKARVSIIRTTSVTHVTGLRPCEAEHRWVFCQENSCVWEKTLVFMSWLEYWLCAPATNPLSLGAINKHVVSEWIFEINKLLSQTHITCFTKHRY